ncbi:MAG: NAD(P)H-binding protein [Cytophagales bacterium]|nr:NAD(P)H-binding protein [Cytophagales bacterium]
MNHPKENARKNILVLGGTGKTGRRVIQRLTQRGLSVRSGSRSGTPPFDWEKPVTWQPVLAGVQSVYVAFQPDLAVPGAVETIRAFARAAVDCGVQQLVLLSGRGEPEARQCEQVVMQSGLDWTILRCSWFCQNFCEGYLLEPLLAGHVVLPAGAVAEPFVDADDIADVAVAALTSNVHSGQVYELTGPRLLTFAEAVGEIARAAGRSIGYEPVPLPAYAASLSGYGVPESYVKLLEYLFGEVLDGRNASLGDGVERALGRKPTDFARYARNTASTGVWQVPAGQQV